MMNFLTGNSQQQPKDDDTVAATHGDSVVAEDDPAVRHKRMSMEGMIANAIHVLQQASATGMTGVPKGLFQKCHGVILLSSVSNSFMVSFSAGTGIVVPKLKPQQKEGELPNNNNATTKWGLPSAVAMTGTGVGIGMGVTYQDIIVFIMDEASLQSLATANCKGGNVGLTLGAHAGMTLGVGRTMGVSATGKSISIAFTKGASIGASIDGGVIATRNDANEKFYEQKGIQAIDILLQKQPQQQNDNTIRLPPHKEHVMDEVYTRLDALSKQADAVAKDSTGDDDSFAAVATPEMKQAVEEVISGSSNSTSQ